MFNLGVILGILLLGVPNFSSATNYCDPELCDRGTHIGCNHDGKFASICENASVIEITPQIQKAILYQHNDLRNKVANGTLPRFESAKRMTTMKWDDELAYLAGLNVLQCEMVHDPCHNTFEYRYSGQNLAIQFHSAEIDPAEYEKHVVDMIKDWYNEHKYAKQSDMDTFTPKPNAKPEEEIGHFTALMQEKSSKVGCSLAKFRAFNKRGNNKIKYYVLLFACNYNFTNMVGFPIYVKGTMCSACKTGSNPDFNGLCSVLEEVAPYPVDDDESEDGPGPSAVAKAIVPQPPVKMTPAPRVTPKDNKSAPMTKSPLTVAPQAPINTIPSPPAPPKPPRVPVFAETSIPPKPIPAPRLKVATPTNVVTVSEVPTKHAPTTNQAKTTRSHTSRDMHEHNKAAVKDIEPHTPAHHKEHVHAHGATPHTHTPHHNVPDSLPIHAGPLASIRHDRHDTVHSHHQHETRTRTAKHRGKSPFMKFTRM